MNKFWLGVSFVSSVKAAFSCYDEIPHGGIGFLFTILLTALACFLYYAAKEDLV